MRKSVEIPQLQCLDNVVDMPGVLSGADVRTPVEFPQVPFLDKLFMHVVVSGADVQTALNTRGDFTGAVLGQVVHARCCVWCG